MSKTKSLIQFFQGEQTGEQSQLDFLQVLNPIDATVVLEICILFPGQTKSSALLSL